MHEYDKNDTVWKSLLFNWVEGIAARDPEDPVFKNDESMHQ